MPPGAPGAHQGSWDGQNVDFQKKDCSPTTLHLQHFHHIQSFVTVGFYIFPDRIRYSILKSSVCFSLKALLLICFGFSGVSIDVFIFWAILVALEIFDSSFLLAMNRDIYG